MHYLDHAATTPVEPEVVRVVADTLQNCFANPSALYAPGMQAEQLIEQSRATVAFALGCPPDTVCFTGGGTESDNIALLGAARARKGWGNHIVATGYEHPAVTKPLEMLARQEGFHLTLVPPAADGLVDLARLVGAVDKNTVLVAAMQLNNETGAELDVVSLAAAVKVKNSRTAVHVDGVQAFTKQQPMALENTAIDSYAVSAHKLGGPKGVGALYLRKGFSILPPLAGGGQEKGVRPGTQNTAYIAGFAKAVELALQNRHAAFQTITALQSKLLNGLAALGDIRLNSPQGGWPGIVNFSLPGVRSETMLHFLEQKKIYLSSGSSCDKGKPSHTLTAMGLPKERVDTALRVSLAGGNTLQDIDMLLATLREGLATLARSAPGR